MNESDLRAALKKHATVFRPAPDWLGGVPRRAAAVKTRNTVARVAVLTAAAVASFFVVRPAGTTPPPTTASEPVYLHLVGYQAPVDRHLPDLLLAHLGCMHDHGFDLPDPEWTGHGWMITVEDARSAGIGTPRWKRTAFITCALDVRGGSPPSEIRDAILHPRHRGSTP